jgi:hypothetical protein
MQIQWQIKLRVVLLDVFSVAHNRDHGSTVTRRRLDHVTTSVKLPYRISVADGNGNKLLNARLEAAVSRCLGTRTKSGEKKNLRATLHIIPTFFIFVTLMIMPCGQQCPYWDDKTYVKLILKCFN